MARTPDPTTPLRSSFAHPWRIAFVAYVVVLTVATHWPNLRIAAPPAAHADKTLHWLAFGGLTLLLWRTRWVCRLWLLVPIAFAWCVLDEISQGIPGLGRFVTVSDAVAGMLGVLTVVAWIWAVQPVGAESNRLRVALQTFAFDRMFQRPRTWLVHAGLFLACATPTAIALRWLDATAGRRVFVIGVLIWLHVAVLTLLGMWKVERRLAAHHRLCFVCGRSCRDSTFDDGPTARCAGCDTEVHRGQWLDPAGPPPKVLLPTMAWPLGVIMTIVVVGFALITLSPVLYAWILQNAPDLGVVPRLAHVLGRLPEELTNVIDLTLYAMLFALGVRLYRGRLARYFDQSTRCRRCGHDLRATPTADDGAGRCGECGTAFVRFAAE
jgi:hypothetical protein